jgi:hypothetical protein
MAYEPSDHGGQQPNVPQPPEDAPPLEDAPRPEDAPPLEDSVPDDSLPEEGLPPARTVPEEWTRAGTRVGRPQRGRKTVAVLVAWVVMIGAILVAQHFWANLSHSTLAKSVAPSPTAAPSTRQSAPAVVPGWQAVVGDGGGVAYDVPADWHVSDLGDGLTLHDNGWQLAMTMPASYLDGYCKTAAGSSRAMAGTGTVPQPNAVLAAEQTAKHVADFAYGPAGSGEGAPPTETVSGANQVEADGITGELVTARVVVNQPDSCGPAGALVDVFALPNPTKHESVVVIAFADQQFTGAVSQHDLDRIVTSIRPLPAH